MNNSLSIRDFTYLNDPEIGPSYQNCAYAILVGRKTYACTYKGQTFTWGLESIQEAVEAVEKFDNDRRKAQTIFAQRRAARRNLKLNQGAASYPKLRTIPNFSQNNLEALWCGECPCDSCQETKRLIDQWAARIEAERLEVGRSFRQASKTWQRS